MEQQEPQAVAKKGLDRRNIITGGLAALSGAVLAKLAGPEKAAAGHDTNIVYDSQTTMHLDVTNTTAGSTRSHAPPDAPRLNPGRRSVVMGNSRRTAPDGALTRRGARGKFGTP